MEIAHGKAVVQIEARAWLPDMHAWGEGDDLRIGDPVYDKIELVKFKNLRRVEHMSCNEAARPDVDPTEEDGRIPAAGGPPAPGFGQLPALRPPTLVVRCGAGLLTPHRYPSPTARGRPVPGVQASDGGSSGTSLCTSGVFGSPPRQARGSARRAGRHRGQRRDHSKSATGGWTSYKVAT